MKCILAARVWCAGLSRAVWALIIVDFVDELTSGFQVISSPGIKLDLQLSYTQVGSLLLAGQLLGFVIEPWIFAASDRRSKKRIISGAMFVLAALTLLAALARNYVMLLAAVALSGPAAGAVMGVSQTAAIDLAPENKTAVMARWTLLGTLGDVLAPAAAAAAYYAGFGWRSLLAAAALLWFGYACVIAAQPESTPLPADGRQDDAEESLWQSFRLAVAAPGLLRWAALLQLVVLLDEVLVAFGALYFREVLGLRSEWASLMLMLPMAGSVAGLLCLERRAQRLPTGSILRRSCCLCLAGTAMFLLSGRSLALAALAGFIMGFAGAALYPLMKAAAYEALPGRSGTTMAVLGLFAPIGIVLPLIMGVIGDAFGLEAAIAFTAVAPLTILIFGGGRAEKPRADEAAPPRAAEIAGS